MKLLEKLQKLYKKDLFIHGSYVRYLLKGTSYNDIDIIVLDTYTNLMRMLDNKKIEYRHFVAYSNPILVRFKITEGDTKYDLCALRDGLMTHETFEDYLGSFPKLYQTVYKRGDGTYHITGEGEVSEDMAYDFLDKAQDEDNPYFSFKWFCKSDMGVWERKYGKLPDVEHLECHHQRNGRETASNMFINIYEKFIPESERDSPYSFLESDLWVSKYLTSEL